MDASVNEQHLRFRWNDHMQHISKILSVQRLEEQFCDCTLVSDDGFILKAHQAILASTSAYFLRVLAQVSPDQHPIIVLRGANFREMSCLLDYMYQGNTQIEQSLMESILEVADMLDVKGLSRIRSNTSMDKFVSPLYTSGPASPASPLTSVVSEPTTTESNPDIQRCSVRPEKDGNTSISETVVDVSDVLSWKRQNPPATNNENSSGQCSSSLKEDYGNSIHISETAEQQVSGIDLTLAKHEPASPKESNSSAKRRCTYTETSVPKKKSLLVEDKLKDESSFNNITSYSIKKIERHDAAVRQENLFLPHSKLSLSSSLASSTDSSICSTLKSSLFSNKDQNIESEQINKERIPIMGSVEIPCQGGPFTISLTTGQREIEKPYSSVFKRKSLFCRSMALKRAKRKHRARKVLEDNKRKWLAKERKALFGESDSQVAERPITRALEIIKSKGSTSAEHFNLNCDLFPLDNTNNTQNNNDKENTKTYQKENVTENVSRVATSTKQTRSRNNKESGCNWEINDGRVTSDEKSKESAQGCLKYPAINPLSLYTLPPVKEKEKQTRTTLTLEEKVKVIEAFLDGKSQRQIAHLYGIGKTQVSGIIKRREEILTIYRDSLLRGEKLTMKRQRKSEYALLNQHLIQWYRHMTVVAGVKITTGMLRAKALQIAPELGYNDFKASNGWLATFKANNNLKFSKQRKPESFDDQMSNYQHHEIQQRDEDESFFEEGEGEDSSSSNMVSMKTLGGPLNLNSQGNNQEHGNNNSQLSASERLGTTTGSGNSTDGVAPTDMSSSLVSHPGLAIGVAKATHHQMANHGSLGPANLTAAAAYNLSRDLTRDLARGVSGGGESSSSVADLTSSAAAAAAMNASTLNHPMTAALNVSRAVIDNQLSKPGESALSAYKSEEPLAPYGYGDHQNRMNDHSARGAEYNYTPYGFPGSYYGYHFLGQY